MANKIVTKDVLINTLKDVAESVNEINDQVNKPQVINIEYQNNTASVGLDTSGTKYNMIESPETTIELNGRTLVNLWGNKRSDFTYTSGFASFVDGFTEVNFTSKIWANVFSKRAEMFKPSTEYTVICNVKENTLTDSFWINTQDSNKSGVFANFEKSINAGTTGIFVYKGTTMSDISNCTVGLRSAVRPSEIGTRLKFQCIILEGDYTNVPIKYFEGIKSAGETNGVIEVKSTGKNLFNTDIFLEEIKGQEYTSESGTVFKNPSVSKGSDNNSLILTSSSYQEYLTKYKLPCHGTYTISVNFDEFYGLTNENTTFKLFYWVKGQGFELIQLNSLVLGENIKMTFTGDAISIGGWSYYGTAKLSNIQLEHHDSATPYEPYKEQVTTLPEIEPLRSLPNGVCDEAFIHDDKLVITRNCGKYTLNGTEEFAVSNSNNNISENILFAVYKDKMPFEAFPLLNDNTISNIYCDKFNTSLTPNEAWVNDIESLVLNTGNVLYLTINPNKLSSGDVTGLKQWLNSNEPIIIYQLATPTYEWYELPSPHLYKDGHLFIETGAIPLTSNSHEVDVSVRSVIDTNVEEIRQLKERQGVLENDMLKETEVYIEEDFNMFTMSDNAIDTNDTEIKLNGRTLVNLTHTEFNNSYEFACDSVNVIDTTYTKEKTLTSIKVTLLQDLTSWNYIRAGYVRHEMLKPNTQYTAIFEKAVGVVNVKISNGGGNIKYAETHNIINNKALITTLATLPTPTSNDYVHMFVNLSKTTAGHVAEVSNILLLEGDWTNVDIPISYFVGLKSAEPTTLVSCGKNLFDINNIFRKNNNPTYTINNYGISINSNGVAYASLSYQFAVEPNTSYTLSYRSSSTYLADTRARLYIFGENGSYIDGRTPSGQYAITFSSANSKLINFTLYATIETAYNATVTFENIQLEKGTEVTPYEPHINDTVMLPEIEPLRSLPNGVCDKMEIKDDKLVITRQCGEVLLNGSEAWVGSSSANANGYYRFYSTLPNAKDGTNLKGYCDKLPLATEIWGEQSYACLQIGQVNTCVYLFYNDISTAEELKTKLSNNPITVVYPIATPVIEEYDLRSLHLYKHFLANTGAIPLTSNTHNEHYTTKDVIVANTEELLIAKKNIARLEGIIEQLLARIATLETANVSVEE